MRDLPRAFALSLGQLGDPAILKVLAKSLAITLAVFAALGGLLWVGFAQALERYAADYAGVGALLTLLVTLVAGWLLFRFVALAVIQFFADDVVRAVERRHYAVVADVPDAPFAVELRASGRGLTRALAVNAVVLPFALVLLVTGVGTALLFWAANAWLLGRELTEMVWLRHRDMEGVTLPVGAGARFALGGLVAALLAVPIVNFVAPVLGAAAAAHLVHGRRIAHA